MRLSPPDPPTPDPVCNELIGQRSSGWRRRFKETLEQFKADLRVPLPGTEGRGRGAKIKARFAHLTHRYGWRLLLAIVLYYLIRDSLLYIVIPYLTAKKLLD